MWTPTAPPANTWSSETPPPRVFDPYVFNNIPVFDTGTFSGIWLVKARPSANWTVESAP